MSAPPVVSLSGTTATTSIEGPKPAPTPSHGALTDAMDWVKRAGHPQICALHLGFKVAALLAYMIGRYIKNTIHIIIIFEY